MFAHIFTTIINNRIIINFTLKNYTKKSMHVRYILQYKSWEIYILIYIKF